MTGRLVESVMAGDQSISGRIDLKLIATSNPDPPKYVEYSKPAPAVVTVVFSLARKPSPSPP